MHALLRAVPPWPAAAAGCASLVARRLLRRCSSSSSSGVVTASPPPPSQPPPTAAAAPESRPEPLVRLDALLSRCGYCSRSEARALVASGRVRVARPPSSAPDSAAATSEPFAGRLSPSTKLAPSTVLVDGCPLEHPGGLLLLLHKPTGYVCSRSEADGKPVFDLLPERMRRRTPPLAAVGRLDKDASGALLLTDVGPLVQRLTAPKHKLAKVYHAATERPPPAGAAAAFASGEFVLDGAPCAPAELIQESASAWGGSFPAAPEPTVATTAAAGDDRPARARGSGAAADDAAAPEAGVAPAPAPPPPPRLPPPPPGAGGFVRVVLTEGRHHQVKRMLSAAGCGRTLALHRSQFAGYALETLQPGQVAVLPLPPAGGWVREGWPGGGGGEGDGAAGEGGAGE